MIRKEIIKIFNNEKSKRIAISAFVGKGSESYLPNMKGLKVICWPHPQGTNPNTIRHLIANGAKVFFSDSMHMKIYWTKNNGAIITSANLSTNALGMGNLKEIGVLLPSNKLNINDIVATLNARKVTKKELLNLDRNFNLYHSTYKGHRPKQKARFFNDWYQMRFRPNWNISIYEDETDFSEHVLNETKKIYNRTPISFISIDRKKDFEKGDWILCSYSQGKKELKPYWQFIDLVIREKGRDYSAVQVWPKNRYPSPPFKLDGRFRSSFNKAIKKLGGVSKIHFNKPTPRFLDLIIKQN